MKKNSIQLKFTKLKDILGKTGGIAVAFSGGVDSTFLLETAHNVLGRKTLAVIARSSTYPAGEFRQAAGFVRKRRIPHEIIISEELDIKGFSQNPADRCYFCKRELLKKVKDTAKMHGIKYVADGSNADDAGDYRPGMRAVKELKVMSPLKQAGLTKQEIRLLSRKAGLPTWDKPAMACLASRFPYGNEITRKKLNIVEKAELALFSLGFKQVRVRHHGDIARIEVAGNEMQKILNKKLMKSIDTKLKKLGFKYVSLDLAGYRTGSMNDTLPAVIVGKREKT
jgi:pyridinium-3,5-biscarboxylic acid mononucleotide sulfurtransferase